MRHPETCERPQPPHGNVRRQLRALRRILAGKQGAAKALCITALLEMELRIANYRELSGDHLHRNKLREMSVWLQKQMLNIHINHPVSQPTLHPGCDELCNSVLLPHDLRVGTVCHRKDF